MRRSGFLVATEIPLGIAEGQQGPEFKLSPDMLEQAIVDSAGDARSDYRLWKVMSVLENTVETVQTEQAQLLCHKTCLHPLCPVRAQIADRLGWRTNDECLHEEQRQWASMLEQFGCEQIATGLAPTRGIGRQRNSTGSLNGFHKDNPYLEAVQKLVGADLADKPFEYARRTVDTVFKEKTLNNINQDQRNVLRNF